MQWFVRRKTKVQTFDGTKAAKEEEDWAIIGLRNDGNGVPATIIVEGAVKCAVCQGFTEDRLICEECTAAVSYLRAADHLDAFITLMEFASQPGMLTLLNMLMQDDLLSDFFMKRMEDARNRA